tara:strand:- start:3654 stop:3788 length:135 start_codon:yes stop_codon:yes gene_type:complete
MSEPKKKKKKYKVRGVLVEELPEGRLTPYEKTIFDFFKRKKKKR